MPQTAVSALCFKCHSYLNIPDAITEVLFKYV